MASSPFPGLFLGELTTSTAEGRASISIDYMVDRVIINVTHIQQLQSFNLFTQFNFFIDHEVNESHHNSEKRSYRNEFPFPVIIIINSAGFHCRCSSRVRDATISLQSSQSHSKYEIATDPCNTEEQAFF